ncbi:hypothetical protein ACJMQP_04175 [Rhodopseudomonas palustris]
MYFFAWAGEDETQFNPARHVREDELIFSYELTQAEGDFAHLNVTVRNPRIGLLAPGREVWAWFGITPDLDSDEPEGTPMFFGRLLSTPTELSAEVVSLQFVGQPVDYEERKAEAAERLKVAPYWDSIWFSPDTVGDPDNVLESRPALWHVDPVTHEVTASDIITGEGGTITVDESVAFDDGMNVAVGQSPTRRVDVTATITWDQVAEGDINIFSRAFDTYTGDGLVANWPKSGASIGGGWSVGYAAAKRVDDHGQDMWTYDTYGILGYSFASHGKSVFCPKWEEEMREKGWLTGVGMVGGNTNTTRPAHVVVVRKWTVWGDLRLHYSVSRGKTESLQFSLWADVQPVVTDDTKTAVQALTFSSSEIVNPDPNGAVPIGKASNRTYLASARGTRSIEYLLCVARAKLLASARCIDITFEVPVAFAVAQGVSTRKNVAFTDRRLPGGVAAGKVKSYTYRGDGDSGAESCSITIGCTVGNGGEVRAVEGEPTYVESGYVESGYQFMANTWVMPIPGAISYRSIEGLAPDDDGIDFDRIHSFAFLQPWRVQNLADYQEGFIPKYADEPGEIYEAINKQPTTFSMRMRPLNSGPFFTAWVLDTTALQVPKTIDLEAESLP